MKKPELAKEVAKERGVAAAKAADDMDRAVNRIVRALRKGHEAKLPGIGTISPGRRWVLRPDPEERRREAKPE